MNRMPVRRLPRVFAETTETRGAFRTVATTERMIHVP